MTSHPEFAYAQARLQARHGRRPGPQAWQALEASHTAAHGLALAKAGPLARWTDALDDAGDVHRIEGHLRAGWRRYVDEVARWLPARWHASVRWFGGLSELALSTSAEVRTDTDDAMARWLAEWQRRLPPDAADGAAQAQLRRPAELLLPRLRGGAGSGRAMAAQPTHRDLLLLFRRHAGSALAVFAHLALVALDVERLRGALVVLVLFEARPEPAPA